MHLSLKKLPAHEIHTLSDGEQFAGEDAWEDGYFLELVEEKEELQERLRTARTMEEVMALNLQILAVEERARECDPLWCV